MVPTLLMRKLQLGKIKAKVTLLEAAEPNLKPNWPRALTFFPTLPRRKKIHCIGNHLAEVGKARS